MVKLVAYDADGCLFDTRAMIMDGYTHVATAHGLVAPTFEEVSEFMGKPVPDILAGLYPDANHGLLLATIGTYAKEHATKAVPYAGAHELLSGIRALGVKQAIVTSGSSRIHEQLLRHGVAGLFSSVVHAERVTSPKPHPEGLELALRECQVEGSEAIVVGDMPDDILMGKEVHARVTIGVSHGFSSSERLQAAGADHIATSLGELSFILHELITQDN